MTHIRTDRTRWWSLIGAATILVVLLGLFVYGFGGNTSSDPLALTKDGLTIRLTSARSSADGMELIYFPDIESGGSEIYHISVPNIRYGDGTPIDVMDDAIVGSSIVAKVDVGLRNVPEGGSVDVDMGSWLISDPGLSGTSEFSLNENLADAIPDSGASNTIKVSGSLSVNSRSYKITELILDRITEYENFYLKVVPVDEAAQKTELASTNVAQVSLADNIGNAYRWIGTRTRWRESDGGEKVVAWQQLSFVGMPTLSASSFSLRITGGGKVAGPFIFENVPVVYEDAVSNGTQNGPSSGDSDSQSHVPTGNTQD